MFSIAQSVCLKTNVSNRALSEMAYGWLGSRLYFTTTCFSSRHYFVRYVLWVCVALLQVYFALILQEWMLHTISSNGITYATYTFQNVNPPFLAPPPHCTWIHNRIFRISIHTRERHCTFSRLLHVQNYVCGCDTNISTSPCRRIATELWASFLQKFSEFIWENIQIFTFLNYSILWVPLDPPNVLCLKH